MGNPGMTLRYGGFSTGILWENPGMPPCSDTLVLVCWSIGGGISLGVFRMYPVCDMGRPAVVKNLVRGIFP